jgi:hypothetical protein
MSYSTNATPETALQALEGYKPSGKTGPLGIPLLVATLLIVPPLLAWIYNATSHFGGLLFSNAWILIATSGLLGLLVGGAFFPAIQWGKIRNPALATVIVLLAALLTFGFSLGHEAWTHRDEVRAALQSRNASTQLSPVENAKAYWNLKAEGGQLVTGRRGRGANIDGGMFWTLLGLQALIAAVLAAVVGALLAGRRFSEANDRWFASKTLYNILPHHLPEIIAAGNAGDWPRFKALCEASKDPNFKEFKPAVTLYYLSGKPDGIVEIRATVDPKKPITAVFERKLSKDEIKFFWPEFKG